jgi:hypothetical protein
MNIHITNKQTKWIIYQYKQTFIWSYDLLRPKSQNMYTLLMIRKCYYLFGLSMTYFKVIEINDFKLYYGSREYFNRTT